MRIHLEAEAKLQIQAGIFEKEYELVWSYIVEYENMFNPHEERRNAIQKWKKKATTEIIESEKIITMAERYMKQGVKAKDALHLACAAKGNCDYFLTTDDQLLSKKDKIKEVNILNPLDFIQLIK
jgi:predicted nucleic acid-binding protein